MRFVQGGQLMDAVALEEPRRLDIEISNRWGGGTMSVLEFGDASRPVDLVFVHANGFNAYTYRRLLQPLSGALRIWAPDLRGHGQTKLPLTTDIRRGWQDHRDDMVSLLKSIDGPPVALAGHSIGGVSSLLAAAEVPERVSRLLLLDPVIWGRLTVAMFHVPGLQRVASHVPIVKSTLRRRAVFESHEQALNSWRGRGAFKGWPEAALADYVSSGLVESEDGLVLTCSPQWEASNYASQSHNPWRAMRRYKGTIRILKAETDSLATVSARTVPRNVSVETVEGGGHLFPMTHMEQTRDALYDLAV